MVPLASIASTFPWEKVCLLVEYEPLSSSLFPEGQLPACLQLKQWAALRTVQDISASSLALSGLYIYMKVKIKILICTGLMLNDHSNPYIESTTVLSDTYVY